MSAGLAASTVTPGHPAPVVSRATPAMAPVVDDCARDDDGTNRTAMSTSKPKVNRFTRSLLTWHVKARGAATHTASTQPAGNPFISRFNSVSPGELQTAIFYFLDFLSIRKV